MTAPHATPLSLPPWRDARPLARLLDAGRALLATIAAVIGRTLPAVTLPHPYASNPATAHPRVARTLEWIEALARTLAGDRHFLSLYRMPFFAGRYPALTAKLRAEIGLSPLPPRTEAQRAADRLYTIRKVFARDATGVIAARLARRLGLTPADPAWPSALLPLTQTPAELATTRPVRVASPPPQPPEADNPAPPPTPAFHKRE